MAKGEHEGEILGTVFGRTKAEATRKLNRKFGPLPKGERFHLEYLRKDPPFLVYEYSIDRSPPRKRVRRK